MGYQIDQSGKIEQTNKDIDIIKALKKTDERLRECLSTLVDAQTRSSKKRVTHKNKKVKRKNRVRR